MFGWLRAEAAFASSTKPFTASRKTLTSRIWSGHSSGAGIKPYGNACAAGRTLVEDRERGVVTRDPKARVVIANRDRR
ncbi:MAG: hypothetical protein M3Q91_10655, partial [Acidobacteriota bacterium]|nr:hypothetical protein [Acidobacteriota bacterium]